MRRRRIVDWTCRLTVVCFMSSAAVLPAQGATQGQAQAPKSIHFFLGGSFTFGGDTLAYIYMSDDTEKLLKAGALFDLKGGIAYAVSPIIHIRGSIGAHHNEISAKTASGGDGSIGFPRFPLEGMVFFRANEKLNFGAGVRKVVGAVIKGSGAFSSLGSKDMESSLGLIIEAEYRLKQWGFFGRYVSEKFRYGSYGNWKDGGHVGLGAIYYFK